MKKQYMAPLTEVVKINAEQMICESVNYTTKAADVKNTQEGGGYMLGKDDVDYDEDLW